MSTHVELRDDAVHRARVAADRLGLRIAELTEAASHHVAAGLLQRVWRADSPDTVISASLMTAFAYAGNYVVGAYRDDEMVAAAVGFFGVGHLHSHVTGVDRATSIRGVGFALKQHQRAWALSRGTTQVCWTFDPLVGRNAYFNLQKLGAAATAYLTDFYGELADGINSDDPTDRLYVRWDLESPAATSAANGRAADVDATRFAGATVLVDRDGDRPAVIGGAMPAAGFDGGALPGDGGALLVAVPEDIEQLRGKDPALAAQWRYAVRWALREALAAGYRIEGISRDGRYALAIPGRS